MEIAKAAAPKDYSSLKKILHLWQEFPPLVKLLEKLNSDLHSRLAVTGLNGSSDAFLVKSLWENSPRPVLYITQNQEQANNLFDDLSYLINRESVFLYPSRQILPYDFKAPVGEVIGQRIAALSTLTNGDKPIIVAPIRAVMEPTISPVSLEANRLVLQKEKTISIEELVQRLINLGFRKVANVEEVGDFARRGGLVDFFSPGFEAPVRVELFGDEIDTIRQFDVATQRTIGRLEQVSLLPKREILITQESLEDHLAQLPEADAEFLRDRYLKDPELPGLEWLALLFGLEQGRLLDYLSSETLVFFESEASVKGEAQEVMDEAIAMHERFRNRLSQMPEPRQYYPAIEDLFSAFHKFSTVNKAPFKGGGVELIDFECKPHPAFGSRLDLLGATVREFEAAQVNYFIATDSEGQASRLADLMEEKSQLTRKPNIEIADLRGGFVCQSGGFAILTDHEIFSRYYRRIRKKRFKEGIAIADYSSLNRGDFVVHTDYGIARYMGLETLLVDKRRRDCLLLQYADNGKLYVPIEEFNRVSKYSGKDTAPQLTALGGPGWEKLKTKTQKAIEEMAEELLQLYASRKAQSGYPFGEDTVWLKQLEASFVYEETPDQLKAINDVKRDMTSPLSMDRLICGDVGYGKTEVAIRAAFKAIEKGKQVALLVPTTILAQQHFQTFKERFRDYPIRVELLSRFRTRKEQLATVDDLAVGKVEMVIGTHRLFSKDVTFKDLGLLIVDEEHRFGVKHKEKLRQIKINVDTLSMTATPIPRTLQMSLIGVRDMSLIATSPKDRLPIYTEVTEFDPTIISAAILREIGRGGQVFFVHNRVQTIDAMYNYLKKIVPQAEIAVAHGQMHERSLEGVMLAFMSKRFNVLLCTSIIESGLDISSANTIIINRADRFGLAQMYQIRGRVGRSSQRAFAYLLTPPVRLLKADAVKRLRAIEAHSDLGSGFALAMRDLEIRGAGTILGARQSGFIEEIGFDLYNKLLEETIARLKGEEFFRLPECKLETDIEMVLPPEYVHNRQQKVDIYRRLADAKSLSDVDAIRDEVVDRFGVLPQPAMNLFDGTAAKIAAALLDIEKVIIKSGRVALKFKDGRVLKRSEVESLRQATDCPMEFNLVGRPQITIDMGKTNESTRLSDLRGILSKV